MAAVELIGTAAFAISGALVGVRKEMDVFGVNVLAVTTACGGGIIRDLLVGNTPPAVFQNPRYVMAAALMANVVFLLLFLHREMPRRLAHLYENALFWCDTLGLAAFTVDGALVGVRGGFQRNLFLVVFLGVLTGVGGGVLRDVLAGRIPEIFRKHIYALAAVAGALTLGLALDLGADQYAALAAGAGVVVLLRVLAKRFNWNLPRVRQEPYQE